MNRLNFILAALLAACLQQQAAYADACQYDVDQGYSVQGFGEPLGGFARLANGPHKLADVLGKGEQDVGGVLAAVPSKEVPSIFEELLFQFGFVRDLIARVHCLQLSDILRAVSLICCCLTIFGMPIHVAWVLHRHLSAKRSPLEDHHSDAPVRTGTLG